MVEQQRKVMTFAVIGGLVVLGMTLFSSMRTGEAIKSGDWKRPKGDPNIKAILPPKPKFQLIPVNAPVMLNTIRQSGNRTTMLYVWESKCLECGEDLKQLQKMNAFYLRYKIGVTTLTLDLPSNNKYLTNYFAHHRFVPKLPVYQRNDPQPTFFQGLYQKYQGAVPAFLVFNRQGKLVDFWSGKTPIKQIDSRFRQSFSK